MHLILIGLGGFFGAISRHLVDGWISSLTRTAFPFGTLTVNVTGSVLAGVLFALMVERAALPLDLRGPLVIGFVGAYTTFSAIAMESWRLLDDGAWVLATLNVAGSIVLGLAALMAGMALGRWL